MDPPPAPLTESEVIVLNYVNEKNRPLNSENVADGLKLKNDEVEKALKALADMGSISFKEYGKEKIYIARQDRIIIPNDQELAEMKETNNKLQHDLDEKMKAINVLEEELKYMVTYPTVEQIMTKEAQLKEEVNSMEEKLDGLHRQVTLGMVGQWKSPKM